MEADNAPDIVVLRHETRIDLLELPAGEVLAGADMPLRIGVTCLSECNLQDGKVQLMNEEGSLVWEGGLVIPGEEASETGDIIVKAPAEPGSHTWTVLFLSHEVDGIQHEEQTASFVFTVKPHLVSMVVWGVPSPATISTPFKVNVGAACDAGCSLLGHPVEIYDSSGVKVATGNLNNEPLPESNSLYWSKLGFTAPAEEGVNTWTAAYLPPEMELPHQVIPARFTFNALKPPEHTVTVEVVDKYEDVPVENASILVNLRRANTDGDGIATVDVNQGSHILYISKKDYADFQTTVEVLGDVKVKAEITASPEFTG